VQKPLAIAALIVAGALASCGPSPPPTTTGPSGAGAPKAATPAPLADAAERQAERLCACRTAACAAAVAADVSDLLAAHPERPASGEVRLRSALETMWRCRDRLDQPVDPVDMDGAIGEPGSSGSSSGAGSGAAPAPAPASGPGASGG
jgi:hypothetical protein